MKKILIIISLFASFLFSFTLLQDDDKKKKEKTEVVPEKKDKESKEFRSEIDTRLKEIDKLDFSKIDETPENSDFDAHAELD
ncbi:MAG: hypothetical protein CMO01_23725 [Thalassobius sp.]|nr:hypothetical protein [Thalassovita sp.]